MAIFLLVAAVLIYTATRPSASELLKEGEILYKKGRLQEAVTLLHKADNLNNKSYQTHYLLGKAEEGLGHLDLAIHHMETASSLKPKNSDLHYNMAILYEEQKNFAKAIERLEQAINLEPSFTSAKLMLAKLYVKDGRDIGAINLYEQLLKSAAPIDKKIINLELSKLYRKNKIKKETRRQQPE